MDDKEWRKRLAAAKARFKRVGYSQRAFAKELGVHEGLVTEVLSGRKKCIRGDSHRIAVALGLKDGVVLPPGSSVVEALRPQEADDVRAA